jgi:hypothetical protein
MKHGYGVWKGTNNESYVGEWEKNKAHGYGVHQWSNGKNFNFINRRQVRRRMEG